MEKEELIREAYREWQAAIALFNSMYEPDDVEYAVFNMEARRRNYMRLLNKARREGDFDMENNEAGEDDE